MIKQLILNLCLFEFITDSEIVKYNPRHISPSENSFTYLIYWLSERKLI